MPPISRRPLLALPALLAAMPGLRADTSARQLKFRDDGSFRVLVISDLHYIPEPDKHGIELTRQLIAKERPDLVIANGDNLSGDRCFNATDIQKAVANVATAMEEARVPWAVTLGNHDQDHIAATGIARTQVMSYYESYPHNLNGGWARDVHGAGNKHLLIWDRAGAKPVANLWLIDSGDYVTRNVRDREYDWIHADQIAWYTRTSTELERQYGSLPGVMFFHIPLLEFHEMAMTKKVIGERHEPESTSKVNSGMLAAVLDRGDVKGMFCGHDHVNNYLGLWRGVWLGQCGVAGYRGYPHTPPEDPSNGRARGARMFLFNESTPARFKTWMRFQDGTTNWESWSDAYPSDQLK